jgi:hypothetical protein
MVVPERRRGRCGERDRHGQMAKKGNNINRRRRASIKPFFGLRMNGSEHYHRCC